MGLFITTRIDPAPEPDYSKLTTILPLMQMMQNPCSMCGYLAEFVGDSITSEEVGINIGERVLVLGEINHMPEHIAIVHKGLVRYAFHSGAFRRLTEDEV